MDVKASLVRRDLESVKGQLTKLLMEAHDILQYAKFTDEIVHMLYVNRRVAEKFVDTKLKLDTELNDMRERIYTMFQPYLALLYTIEGVQVDMDTSSGEEEPQEGERMDPLIKEEPKPIEVVTGNRPE